MPQPPLETPADLRAYAARLDFGPADIAPRTVNAETGEPYGRVRVWKVMKGQETSQPLFDAIAGALHQIARERASRLVAA